MLGPVIGARRLLRLLVALSAVSYAAAGCTSSLADGEIVFTSYKWGVELPSGIFVIDSSDSEPRLLLDIGERGVKSLRLSPDGSKVAFVRCRLVDGYWLGVEDLAIGIYLVELFTGDNDCQLRVVDVESGIQNKLATLTADRGVRWSPDGIWINFLEYASAVAYDFQPQASKIEMSTVSADGTGIAQVLTNSGHNTCGFRTIRLPTGLQGPGAWSADSTKIATTRCSYAAKNLGIESYLEDRLYKVFVMDADGANERQLVAGTGSEELAAEWSPDGTKIAYFLRRGNAVSLAVVEADGTGIKELVTEDDLDGGKFELALGPEAWSPPFAWSPDGTRIAFYATSDPRIGFGAPTSEWTLSVVDIDGSALRHVKKSAARPELVPSEFAWSPDGKQIAFSGFHDGDIEVFVIDVDSSNIWQITYNKSDDYVLAWL